MTKNSFTKKQKKACRSRGETEISYGPLMQMGKAWNRIVRDVEQGRITVAGLSREIESKVKPAITKKSAQLLGVVNGLIKGKG